MRNLVMQALGLAAAFELTRVRLAPGKTIQEIAVPFRKRVNLTLFLAVLYIRSRIRGTNRRMT